MRLALPIGLAAWVLSAACAPRPRGETQSHRPPAPGIVRSRPVVSSRIAWPDGTPAGALLGISAIGPGRALAVGSPGAAWIDGGSVRVENRAGFVPTAVWAEGARFALAVGYGGTSEMWDGRRWEKVVTGTTADLLALWGRRGPGRRLVYAAGTRGAILHWSGGRWQSVPAPEWMTVTALAGDADVRWAVGFRAGSGEPPDGAILTRHEGRWIDACPALACGAAIYAAWTPGGDELWTAGSRGELVRYVGSRSEVIRTGTGEDLLAIWGTGSNDLFVAGASGVLLHGNGTAWERIDAGEVDLRAVDGLPTGEGWVAGEDGTITHLAP